MLSPPPVPRASRARLEDAALTRVVDELADLSRGRRGRARAARARSSVSVVRRARSRSSAMLEQEDGAEALPRLLDLPFVDAGRDGLVVHEAVRDAIARFLSSASPNRYRAYRRAAWRALRAEAREAGDRALALHRRHALPDRQPGRPRGVLPERHPAARRRARGRDRRRRNRLDRRQARGPDAAALLERWWNEEPETFSVVRDRDGTVAGFFSVFEGHQLKRSIVDGDPILEAWARDLAVNPLRRAGRARAPPLARRRRGRRSCATQAAAWLDVKRTYMALRPALRRMYVVVQDVPTYWPVVEKLGFRPLPDSEAVLDGNVRECRPRLRARVGRRLAGIARRRRARDRGGAGARRGSARARGRRQARAADAARVRALPAAARARGKDGHAPRAPARGLGDGVRRRKQRRRRRSSLAAAQARPRRSSSRPCAAAATACARLARAPELEHSPNLHQAFIERVGGAPTLDA